MIHFLKSLLRNKKNNDRERLLHVLQGWNLLKPYYFGSFRLSNSSYVLDIRNCTFYDENSGIDEWGRHVICLIDFANSDTINLEYAKAKDGTTHIEHFTIQIDNSVKFKSLNKKIILEFQKAKEQLNKKDI